MEFYYNDIMKFLLRMQQIPGIGKFDVTILKYQKIR